MRVERHSPTHGISYGMDDTLGIFVTIWTLDYPELPPDHEMNAPDEDNILLDKHTVGHQLKSYQIKEIANEYGFHVTDQEIEDLRNFNSHFED